MFTNSMDRSQCASAGYTEHLRLGDLREPLPSQARDPAATLPDRKTGLMRSRTSALDTRHRSPIVFETDVRTIAEARPAQKKAAHFLLMFAKTKYLTNILNVISCEGQPDSTVSESRCPGEIARAKRIRDAYFKDKADGDFVAT